MINDTVPGSLIVIGKYYSHKGAYMGKYLSFKLIGRVYDMDPEYTFEHGVVADLGLMFTEVKAENAENAEKAGKAENAEKAGKAVTSKKT